MSSDSRKASQARRNKKFRETHDALGYERDRVRRAFERDPKGTWIMHALRAARKRAKASGIPFELQKADVELPDVCPVFGSTLDYGRGKGRRPYESPSLDRLRPELGYVRGNVRVVCYRANQLRSDATLEELRRLYEDAIRLA